MDIDMDMDMDMGMDEKLKANISSIVAQISDTAKKCGRSRDDIKLIAVSKTVAADKMIQAIKLGLTQFGENYLQETQKKMEQLHTFDLTWHFIGHLQSNKAKFAVQLYDWIHSVDSFKLAKEIDKCAKKINKIQKILVQINIDNDPNKKGLPKEDALSAILNMSQLSNIRIKGLMTIPKFYADPKSAQQFYAQLHSFAMQIKQEQIPNVSMEELSMGMTNDFQVAIAEGATFVRIGTALFGERQ